MTQATSDKAVFFDSHCHFDFSCFDEYRHTLWLDCQAKQIKHLLIPGVSPDQWPQLGCLAETLTGIVFGSGVHPWWINKALNDKEISKPSLLNQKINKSLLHKQCVAIGECGLDKLIDTPLSIQEKIFEWQLALACEANRPLIIHVRKAHNETLSLIKRYRPKAGGVIHGFTGSFELASVYWQMGFYLGIGGSITYPRANKTRTMAAKMPLESLLLETDAPDMPLNGFQGQDNNPLQVIKVAEMLAELRNDSLQNIAMQTTSNTFRLFQL
jgi:TatD DNase family protein